MCKRLYGSLPFEQIYVVHFSSIPQPGLGLSIGLLSGFQTVTLYVFLIRPMRTTRPTHLTVVISGEAHKWWSSPVNTLHGLSNQSPLLWKRHRFAHSVTGQ
jgi:hypothetical protein